MDILGWIVILGVLVMGTGLTFFLEFLISRPVKNQYHKEGTAPDEGDHSGTT